MSNLFRIEKEIHFEILLEKMFKLVELINSTNTGCIRKLCIFIYQAFKLRTELLYKN